MPVKSEQVNSVWYSSFACVLCMAWRGLTSTAQHVQLEIQVASTIPVRRWGSFKLRHRTVLTDWGVQATHFLKQKARLQQSWQNTNSRHILIYGVYIDFFAIFFSQGNNELHLQFFRSLLEASAIPEETLIFFSFYFFLSGIDPDKPRYQLGLWNHTAAVIFWPTKGSCKFILKQKENTSGFS